MLDDPQRDTVTPATDGAVDYTVLPEHVGLADTVAEQETRWAPDPTMGRDTETEFLLRHAAG